MCHRSEDRCAPLDGLRTLAILLVIAGHCATQLDTGSTSPEAQMLMHFPLIRFGWSGVDLFFVLSGFLIGSQLWKEFRETEKIRILPFLWRRALRIWPLYYLFLVLALLVTSSGEDVQRLWPDFFFLTNYFESSVFPGSWSLSIEEQFYLLAPLFVFWLGRLGLRTRWTIALSLFCLAPLMRFLTLRFQLSHFQFSDLLLVTDFLQKPLQTHYDSLLVGITLAWIFIDHPHRIQKISPWLILFGVNSLAIVLGFSNPPLLGYSGFALLYGGIVWWSVSQKSGALIQFLSAKPFYFISRLSYGMYLNHFFLLLILSSLRDGLLKSFGFLLAYFFYLFLVVGISVAFSLFTFLTVEIPCFFSFRGRFSKSTVRS